MTELEKIKERWAKVTQGDWFVLFKNEHNDDRGSTFYKVISGKEIIANVNSGAYTPKLNDAIAIASAPKDIGRLVKAMEYQKRLIEKMAHRYFAQIRRPNETSGFICEMEQELDSILKGE